MRKSKSGNPNREREEERAKKSKSRRERENKFVVDDTPVGKPQRADEEKKSRYAEKADRDIYESQRKLEELSS